MSGGKIVVRKAAVGDVDGIMSMIQELADFEEMPTGPKLKAADLIRDGNLDGSSSSQLFFSFVAEHENDQNQKQLIGYSISFFSYSTWEGKSYFLEDLYVKPEFRKTGVGKKIFVTNAEFALEQKCTRFDLHVLNWNPAKKFYESLGATNLTGKEGWEFYRLTQAEMERLAADNQH